MYEFIDMLLYDAGTFIVFVLFVILAIISGIGILFAGRDLKGK